MNILYGIGIFVWLAVSFAAILGLIRPSIFAKLLKRFARRRYIFAFGLILFFLIPLAISPLEPASLRNSTVSQQSQPSAAQLKANTAPAKTASPATTQTKQVSVTQAVPFASTTQNDNSLSTGQTKISQSGVNGEETGRVEQSTTITKQPVAQITQIGTYVAPAPTQNTPAQNPAPAPAPVTNNDCTNGTYVNSAGNTVCSPETSSTVPSGATAQCQDGTYSFSQSRSGTCSHHGGVLTWL